MLKCRTAATNPPMKAPRMPTTVSPKRPRPRPRARWLATKPATRPTRTQIKIVSKSICTGAPLTVMTMRLYPLSETTHSLPEVPDQTPAQALGQLAGQVPQGRAKHAVEGGEGMDHVREQAQRGPD